LTLSKLITLILKEKFWMKLEVNGNYNLILIMENTESGLEVFSKHLELETIISSYQLMIKLKFF